MEVPNPPLNYCAVNFFIKDAYRNNQEERRVFWTLRNFHNYFLVDRSNCCSAFKVWCEALNVIFWELMLETFFKKTKTKQHFLQPLHKIQQRAKGFFYILSSFKNAGCFLFPWLIESNCCRMTSFPRARESKLSLLRHSAGSKHHGKKKKKPTNFKMGGNNIKRQFLLPEIWSTSPSTPFSDLYFPDKTLPYYVRQSENQSFSV